MTQMMKSLALAALTGISMAAAAAPAFAQAPRAGSGGALERPLFVDLNGGLASKPGALTTATTFTIFGEDGAAATRVDPGTSAMIAS